MSSSSPKFDAGFLDRRMREHREWQEWATATLESEVVCEVADALTRAEQIRTGYGPAKIARLK